MACNTNNFNLPGNWNPNIYQGCTFNPTVTVTQNGEPFDFTGYSAAMDVTDNEGNVILSLSTENGTISLSSDNIIFNVPASATATLIPGSYVYDLLIYSGDVPPVVTPILAGNAYVIASPTGSGN